MAIQNWADSPFPLIQPPCPEGLEKAHGSLYMAHEMAYLHNIIIRNLNSIYQQAPYIKEPQDIKDFLLFVNAWHDELEHHHETEEKVFFPGLEELTGEKGCMDGNIEQHHQFEPGLEAIGKYAVETTPETYDGQKLREIIDSFGMVLSQHLNEEIDTLKGLKDYDTAALKKIWHKSGEYAKSQGDMNMALPMIIGGYDVTYGKSEIQPPFFVYWLNSLIFSRKYSGAWRFLPCNSKGKPQPLAFGPKIA